MDIYQLKYIKYKNKYYDLKNKIGCTGNIYHNFINKIPVNENENEITSLEYALFRDLTEINGIYTFTVKKICF